MLSFKVNDPGYVAWIETHPDGFVVNTSRNPNPDYLIAHRASCHTISKKQSPEFTWTEGDYMKACASSYAELDRWARDEVGGKLQDCRYCKPQ